ncbi:lycopene beta-cyclase CrtY [Parvularcula dongshanensis]|uniref:Lycopene beta-cyclase n=1 Tax=Parvularcula dongshanensis TaxID=1173995 RepID=A0A840I5H9_9PROT|nr:lycopene beta-cyclase [Parvularcula dongshanensis]
MSTYDLLFAGGGLSSALTAYRVAVSNPNLRIGLVEAADTLGGNHTWSFHETDVTADQHAWIDPFIVHRWPGQKVRFPKRERTLGTGYRSVTSERLHDVLSDVANVDLLTGTPVAAADPDGLTLTDQRRLAGTVLDGRGAQPTPRLTLGFQKFLGQEVRTAAPHGVTVPTIMDATVAQTDGYRFVYVLPFTQDTLLIEDTYYADGADLPEGTLRDEIAAYAARQGWQVAEVLREETGILPIVLEGDVDGFWDDARDGPAPLGLRAGLFHPVTGYSLPDAARLADLVAEACREGVPGPEALFALVENHAKTTWREQRFYRLLNRMLFRAAEPHLRYVVLERFYGLPQALIERFYAGKTTLGDMARVLAGRPPVPIPAAMRALRPERLGREGTNGCTERA